MALNSKWQKWTDQVGDLYDEWSGNPGSVNYDELARGAFGSATGAELSLWDILDAEEAEEFEREIQADTALVDFALQLDAIIPPLDPVRRSNPMAYSYYMQINIGEDRMGSLNASPVSDVHVRRLEKEYGTADAFAQDGMQLHYEVMDQLSKGAQRDIRQGYNTVARVPIDWYYNWVAFHNEPLPLRNNGKGKRRNGRKPGVHDREDLLDMVLHDFADDLENDYGAGSREYKLIAPLLEEATANDYTITPSPRSVGMFRVASERDKGLARNEYVYVIYPYIPYPTKVAMKLNNYGFVAHVLAEWDGEAWTPVQVMTSASV